MGIQQVVERVRDGYRRMSRRRKGVIISLALYFGSYLLLGRHEAGNGMEYGRPVTGQYRYHDRFFPFDPWIYVPAALLECLLRGGGSSVNIEDGRIRGGQAIYGFGPFR